MYLDASSVTRLNQTLLPHSLTTQPTTALDIIAGASSSGLSSSTLVNVFGGRSVLVKPPNYQRSSSIRVVSSLFWIHSPLIFPLGAMELRIIKPGLKYTAGQWIFLQIPEVSRFQWHPVRFSRYLHSLLFIDKISLPSRLRRRIHTSLFISVRWVIGLGV